MIEDVYIPEDERTIWDGSPSQWLNVGPFIACALLFWLVLPVFWALWRYLQVRCTKYRLSTQRLSVRTGVLNVRAVDVEHYRIKDHSLDQPLLLRLVGLGNIDIVTSDPTCQYITLRAIASPDEVREHLRKSVEHVRVIKGVREIELNTIY